MHGNIMRAQSIPEERGVTAPTLARRRRSSPGRIRDQAARASTLSVRTLRLRLRRELEEPRRARGSLTRRPRREPGLRAVVHLFSRRLLALTACNRILQELLTKAVLISRGRLVEELEDVPSVGVNGERDRRVRGCALPSVGGPRGSPRSSSSSASITNPCDG